jgi:hypothetical protein
VFSRKTSVGICHDIEGAGLTLKGIISALDTTAAASAKQAAASVKCPNVRVFDLAVQTECPEAALDALLASTMDTVTPYRPDFDYAPLRPFQVLEGDVLGVAEQVLEGGPRTSPA